MQTKIEELRDRLDSRLFTECREQMAHTSPMLLRRTGLRWSLRI